MQKIMEITMNKIKYLVFSFLFALIFSGCNATKMQQTQTNETLNKNNKELFENKENWKAINKNNVQDLKNFEKVVK